MRRPNGTPNVKCKYAKKNVTNCCMSVELRVMREPQLAPCAHPAVAGGENILASTDFGY